MSDKQKIICIYASVAIISLLIASTWFIRGGHMRPESGQEPYYARNKDFGAMFRLEKDLVLTNQDGEEVRLSELKGKVWAFAQFYAACPMCAERNTQGLKKLYETFKEQPDFHLVCITINPEIDGAAEMKSYAEGLGADTSNWWFLTGDAKLLKDYMVSEMKYQPIIKRRDPEDAATKGTYLHDMAISIYDRHLSMVKRHDLYNAGLKGEAYYKGEENSLHNTVRQLLEKK